MSKDWRHWSVSGRECERAMTQYGDGSCSVRTVLLVEDDPELRQVLHYVMEHAGYRVLKACDGAEAVEAALSYHGHIDLLLTDVLMNGPEAASLITNDRPETRIIEHPLSHHCVSDKSRSWEALLAVMLSMEDMYEEHVLLSLCCALGGCSYGADCFVGTL